MKISLMTQLVALDPLQIRLKIRNKKKLFYLELRLVSCSDHCVYLITNIFKSILKQIIYFNETYILKI